MKRIIRFTMPAIIMAIFTSIYTIVDGFFVSNFVGKTEFAAVNFIMPVLIIQGVFGAMLGAGGSAIVARTLGQKKDEEANRQFSLFIYAGIVLGVLMAAASVFLIRPVSQLLGAEGKMLEHCVTYGVIVSLATPAFMLQYEFQTYFITAEKPKLGLYMTVTSGVCNIVLDALFMVVFPLGIVGAALATSISQVLGGFVPLVYFSRKNTSLLRLVKTKYVGKWMAKAITNGSSEFMSNICFSVVGLLYNYQLLKYAGENGVAAYGVMMYVNMIFVTIFIGFSTGMSPVIGYHFGAENEGELKSLFKKSMGFIAVSSAAMVVLGEAFAYPLSYIFVGYNKELMELTLHGFFIYSITFLFSGIAIFGSAFFTALSDGVTSAIMAFLRTMVFQTAAIIIMPLIWGIEGVWWSIVAAEVAAAGLSVFFIIIKRKKFNYC